MPNYADRRWHGHPPGLAILAGTEIAERFSYYGMTAILVLYMVKQLLLPGHAEHVLGLSAVRRLFEFRGPMGDQAFASLIYGWYGGLVYFTPILGGLLADRWLGTRRTVMLGALLMAAGHLAMSFDSTFLVALAMLICGSGCLKGNISAQVAPLYAPDDEGGRARGFTIFSTGINIGATAGPIATGALAQVYGWHVGFACAAIIMLMSLTVYVAGQPLLRDKKQVAEEGAPMEPLSRDDRRRIGALILLIAINIPIFICYYQITNVGTYWVDQMVDLRTPAGLIPASWFQAIDSFASIVVAVPLLGLWAAQARRAVEPDTLSKIFTGAIINALSPLVLVVGILLAGPGAKVAVGWAIASWFLFGAAFMFYWPLTLGIVAAQAPRQVRSTLMGAAFIALFLGNVGLGWIGSFYSLMSPMTFWLIDSAIGFSAVAMMVVALRPMRRILK